MNCAPQNKSLTFTTQQTRLAANITFVVYTLFVIACATCFVIYKRKFSKTRETLQMTFNAGGEMSISLLTSTIVSQWTWAANLLGTTTAGIQYGLAGVYWYSASSSIQIILFSIVCMEMRIKAPGAQTFLQVIQARFDKKTHILYCIFAIITNFVVAATVLVGAVASINYSFQNIASEYAIFLLIVPTFLFVFIGGLGGFFYVSYFNTLAILSVIIVLFTNAFYSGQSYETDVGDIQAIFKRIECIQIPNNSKQSFKTFMSFDALTMGIIGIIGNFGAVFIDQSYWQLNATSSPKKSSIAFILAGLIWFFIPFVFGTTLSILYVYFNSYSLTDILSDVDISSGVVPPAVAGIMMGDLGTFIVNVIIISTGTIATSAEILAITNILINDIIPVYFKPFKPHLTNKDSLMCILCEKMRGKVGTNKCHCISLSMCKDCEEDDKRREYRIVEKRQCSTHGEYRDYEDYLDKNKHFMMILTAFVMLIVFLLIFNVNLKLSWLYSFMGIIVGPGIKIYFYSYNILNHNQLTKFPIIQQAVVPVSICLFWARINSFSMFYSQITGCIVGIISWILTTLLIYGRIDMAKSGNLLPMLVGNIVSIGTGGILVIILTFCTSNHLNVDQKLEIWEKTRDIDSPLLPWYEIYAKYMQIEEDVHQLRPSLMQIQTELRRYKRASWFISIMLSLLFIVIWPVICLAFDDFNFEVFTFWLISGHALICASVAFFLIGPLLEPYLIKIVSAVKKSSRLFKKIKIFKSNRIRHIEYDN